jgi:flagellar hook-basal body complex protein FliE
MALLPVSPLSPALPLAKSGGSSEMGLGAIPNVADGIPGLSGIGKVDIPGVGVFSPGLGGFGMPSLPNLGAPAPVVSPAPSVTSVPGVAPSPEVTPFPGAGVQPTTTPTPGATAQVAPTPFATSTPQPTTTPVPSAGQLQAPAQGSPYATQPITTQQVPAVVQTPITSQPSVNIPTKQTPVAETFGKYLKDASSNYNDVQSQADSMIQHLAVGDKVDIHDVALAVQKAAITNQLAIQVRNRLVEAYQEVMRMPV